MDTVIRGVFIYMFLLVVFRISGKRTLASISTFDFVLVLILSETVQQGLIEADSSITNAVLLVLTLGGIDILFSELKARFPKLARLIDSTPVVVVKDGQILPRPMKKERVDEADILTAAREQQGISRLDEIAYAIVEETGHISIVPK